MRNWLLCVTVVLLVASVRDAVRADLIRLQSGGEVRGTLRPGHTRDPQVTIDTLSGGVVVVDRGQVALSTVRRVEVEQYEVRTREMPDTVDAHWELAEWCRQNRLTSQREEQLEQIVAIEPNHAVARKALGHVQERGEWMSREDQMAARGYVHHKGKWVTQQELDLLEKSAAERAAEKEWFSKTYAWVRWVAGNSERQRQEGIAQLQQITDPAAVAALSTHMATHDVIGVRRLFVNILKGISGPRPVRALAERSLFDLDGLLREEALAAIRPEFAAAASTAFVPALRSKDNAVVNRAGYALGHLRDRRSVPALIEALVTRHTYQVQVPVDNLPEGMVRQPDGTVLADPRTVSSYLPPDIQLALRAGQLPFGVNVVPPPQAAPQFRQVKVNVEQQNDAVLTALQELTGQNFGYDERTWRLWWAAEGQQEPAA